MTSIFILAPEAVGLIRATGKTAILEQLSERFSDVYGLDSTKVLERLSERERLGSTGFGRGVAIPHARITGITRPVACFLRLEESVTYESADDMPVVMVFGLLSPENAGAAHLHALASISRLMRDNYMHTALNQAPDKEALFGLLSNVIDRDAA